VRRALVPVAAKSLGAAHRGLYRLSRGRIGAHIWTLPVVLLTTTGRTTGKPRTVPLCALPDGPDYIVIASFGGMDRPPAWWLNLERTPDATLQIGLERLAVTARTTSGDERERLWTRVVERAPGYLNYARRTTREIPVVVLARSPA
jgi:deazaflavin-dependent oxidoreductase (nitroreductase family)